MAPRKRIGDLLIEQGMITEVQLKHGLEEQKKSGELLGCILFQLGYISQKDLFNVLAISQTVAAAAKPENRERDISGEIDHLVSQSSSLFNRGLDSRKKELDSLNSPLVALVEKILGDGVQRRATDVHINPDQKGVRVRYRVDGVLQHALFLPETLLSPIVSRFKILGQMDIAETRLPQDGGAEFFVMGRPVDLRISTFPVVGGENVVVRILDKSQLQIGMEHMGFFADDIKTIYDILKVPNGVILVTGPTGSGKTTSLYSFLSVINSVNRNIITLEDPIEYQMPLVRQSQVNLKSGYTFAVGLRSILRQDPDVILVGEMRDLETVKLTIRAALTGHLVFSTLHANDCVATIARLIDMGADPFLMTTTIEAIFSQRLVRTLCGDCREEIPADDPQYTLVGKLAPGQPLYRAAGCPLCDGTGYKGRTVVYEILRLTTRIKEMINNKASTEEMYRQAVAEGFVSMLETGLRKVRLGEISLDELQRVTKLL
ncbi:MAG: Flp pilus assembly complex ATPase component TadA [Desulfobulbaceae bacterium]|nr:Flp pilus assembly complex ATPase component TadA [Desulfobulbaceae bacterium]